MLSLTDMWRAAGGVEGNRPAQWVRTDAGQAFMAFVADNEKLGISQVLEVTRGRNGATWAHWQVAMAYAKHLSPEFHYWCNTVVRSHMERLHAGPTELPVAGPIDIHMPTVLGFVDRAVNAQLTVFREVVLPGLVAIEVRKHSPGEIEGITAGEVIRMAGVDNQTGLRGLARIVSDRLRRYHAQHNVAVREKVLGASRAYIFDRVTCREWLAAGGKATIMQCVAERRGQGHLFELKSVSRTHKKSA